MGGPPVRHPKVDSMIAASITYVLQALVVPIVLGGSCREGPFWLCLRGKQGEPTTGGHPPIQETLLAEQLFTNLK